MNAAEALNVIDRMMKCDHKKTADCKLKKCIDCPFNYTDKEALDAMKIAVIAIKSDPCEEKKKIQLRLLDSIYEDMNYRFEKTAGTQKGYVYLDVLKYLSNKKIGWSNDKRG